MPQITVNALSSYQSNFGSSTSSDIGGWELTAGSSGSGIIYYDAAAYNTYIPGAAYAERFKKASLLAISGGTDTLVIKSPHFDVSSGSTYMASVATVPFGFDAEYVLNVEFYTSVGGSLVPHSTTTFTVSLGDQELIRLMNYFIAPTTATHGRMTVTVSGDDLAASDRLVLFDPFVSNWSQSSATGFSSTVYGDLPTFMILDDENIDDLVNGLQLPVPLRRFVQTLCAVADEINNEAKDFRYDRASDGLEHKSTLTDPDTAKAAYLFWLACVTGSSLLVSSSGFTPWVALEDYEGAPVSGDPGEWEDLESLSDWLSLQDVDPDFFDTVQSFRDQIRTGFTGVNAGRPDTIEAFARTLLSSTTSDTDVVVVRNEDKDHPFRVEILVDPEVDPDPSGDLVVNSIQNGLPAGVVVSKTSMVMESGRNSFDFDDVVYPATHTNSDAAGAVVYGKSFISDIDNYGRHLLLNTNTSVIIPEAGGGIADAHCSGARSYFYGDVSGSAYGSLTTATSTLADLSGGDAYDIVVKITDVTRPTADVSTVADTGSTPRTWLLREKRLLVCGGDSGGSNNDWAIYLVSGITPSADLDTRILLVDGYNDSLGTNYAYSDPIPASIFTENKSMVVRVTKDASDICTFYAQGSIYDNWETNRLGTSSITPSSSSAGSTAYIQVLGQLDNSLWSDATPLSCAVERVMIADSEIEFTGSSVLSDSPHAYVDGGSTTSYDVYAYLPTIDIDIADASVYDSSFAAVTRNAGSLGSLTVTVNSSSTNDIDILAMRPHPTYNNLWYFGHTYGTGNGDTLSVTGLPSADYDWVIHKITTSDGTVDSTTTGSSSSVTQIDFSADDYGGQTILAIEVMTSGGTAGTPLSPGANAVAYFTADTIASTETSGLDEFDYTWEISRTWPTGGSYAPSQVIDIPMIHVYESAPYIHNPASLEIYSTFSYVFKLRRLWTGTEGVDTYNIFSALNDDSYGLSVYYDGPKIKVEFSDGTLTESVEYVESPTFGDWHNVVIRRDSGGLSLVVDGVEHDSTPMVLATPFVSPTSNHYFSEGALNVWNPRFALGEYAFFSRYLSDAEITLLESQI